MTEHAPETGHALLVYSVRLVGAAVAYSLLHHLGLLPGGLGRAPEETRWTDWLDLAVPWVVLGSAALVVRAADADSRTWTIFACGSVAYASGHGIHLAANSVANVDPGPTAHLWDEVVGHLVWYVGVALVVSALTRTMTQHQPPPVWAHLLAVGVGLTWASNALGAGLELLGLAGALVAGGYGWWRRRSLAVALMPASASALALLAVAALTA